MIPLAASAALAKARRLLPWLVVAAVLSSCSKPPPPPPPAVPEVATVEVKPEPVVLTLELPGRTSPFLIAEIRPQVNGIVEKRLFTEGSDVQKGQPLYQIDPAPFKATLANAQAALGRTEASLPAMQSRFDRFRQALSDKAVSQQDLDDADSALKQALADVEYWKAMVETARINLGYAQVVSPIPGRIGKSGVTDGAIVTAYQPVPLASVQQLDPIYVDVPQSATELLRLRRRLNEGFLIGGTNANRVRLLLPDGSPYPIPGALQFRDVSVDPTTGSVILRMVFPNPDAVLLPGMFVRAIIEEGSRDQAILVPQQAVSRNPKGEPLALVVTKANKVDQRMLTLDREVFDRWLVSSGLVSGDLVIAEGMQKVRPGAEVTTVPFAAAPEAGAQPVKSPPATKE